MKPLPFTEKKLLMAGAGGVGCEVAKNLALMGCSDLTIIDYDLVDESNLNRQFMFDSDAVGKFKCRGIAKKLNTFFPSIKVSTYTHNLFNTQFTLDFFRQFDIFIGALDNIDARNRLNVIAHACGVPYIDGGTVGYLGQAESFHTAEGTGCFACLNRQKTKTSIPVCTVHKFPHKTEHCIAWANSKYNDKLFSEGATALWDKIFVQEIRDVQEISPIFCQEQRPFEEVFDPRVSVTRKDMVQPLNITQLATLFHDAQISLNEEETEHSKVHFISAAALIRMESFRISSIPFVEMKHMVNAVIPAIPSTNAFISALVCQACIKPQFQAFLSFPSHRNGVSASVSSGPPQKKNASCSICQNNAIVIDIWSMTIKRADIIEKLRERGVQNPTLLQNGNILVDYDIDDLNASLQVNDFFFTCIDEDDDSDDDSDEDNIDKMYSVVFNYLDRNRRMQ
ncbi:hypothetical protein PCE1_001847 [Barthelona sp. PCE]